MQPCPHAGGLPIAQAGPATHAAPAAHLGRQHLPGQAGPQHEQDAGQHRPIVDRRATTLRTRLRRRQERGDLNPEIVGKQRSSHIRPTPRRPHRAVLLGALSMVCVGLADGDEDAVAPQEFRRHALSPSQRMVNIGAKHGPTTQRPLPH